MQLQGRYLDIRSGTVMVVSDLHGDGDAFDRYLETFMALYNMGEADRLILLGDIIHGYANEDVDHSLRMVLSLMDLQKQLGAEKVIYLLGNHEMPHIYGVSLAKGYMEFTPRFERAMGEHRREIVQFFKSLPFVARTSAGVLFCHAGPDGDSANRIGRLRTFHHDDLIEDADKTLLAQGDLTQVYEAYEQLSGESYEMLAKKYLAVTGKNDPRYSHLLRALYIQERDHRFATLWDFLFTQNERDMPASMYYEVCRRYLDALSVGAPVPQRVCVSGHIKIREGGYMVVNDRHFRFASATHATPRESGKYLLLDLNKPIQTAEALIPSLLSIF